MEITEVIGYQNGEIRLNPLYQFREEGEEENGRIIGKLVRTENPMSNIDKFHMAGLPDNV